MREQEPAALTEAIRYFSDLDLCTDFVANLRWPNGPVCPRCGGVEYSYLKTRRLWKCKACQKQYSLKVGTIFEGSALGLDKWLPAVWVVANSKDAISSHELARSLGTTQKSAWFMLHRIRLAMQTGTFLKLDGEEADDTFIGGSGGRDETIDLGVRQQDGEIPTQVVPDAKGRVHTNGPENLWSRLKRGLGGRRRARPHKRP
jgi:transposase-like protein